MGDFTSPVSSATNGSMSEVEAQYDVFLNHSSLDKEAVEAIARRLLAQGVRPFLDKWHFDPR